MFEISDEDVAESRFVFDKMEREIKSDYEDKLEVSGGMMACA